MTQRFHQAVERPKVGNGIKKDLVYAVGIVNETVEKVLFVYGDCYSANKDTYVRVSNMIRSGIISIEGVEFAETSELGRVNKVDPLGITYLRMRGMWHIETPYKLFKDQLIELDALDKRIISIMKKTKFDELITDELRQSLEKNNTIKTCRLRDPNNPAILFDSIIIHSNT
ncbi:MAG: NgoPII restriction endonuclease [candidate division WS6 bacterium OLB20]|uniref:NgoPII restriction endonuclease n=1 Tax=candidate division WS6 bacterium OLB20 TaxID=1617426 RepID=A0A136LYX9_9BACT|nr:MAG: NgoPII restriction endonuclease [candidate division WS6 bacterium OLB20]